MLRACFALCAGGALVACGEPVVVEWSASAGGPSYSTPAVTADLVVFGNEAGDVVALSRADGKPRWTYRAQRAVVAGPVVWNGRVYVGSTNSLFYALDLMSGAEVWKFPAKDRIKGDAAVDAGKIYFASYDGQAYALRPDRSVAWIFPDQQKLDPMPRDFSYSSPRLGPGVVYLGNLDGHLYALDADTGKLRWRFQTGAAVTSTPWVDGRRVYFGSNDGFVRAVDDAGTEARLVWSFQTGGAVNAAPRLEAGAVLVGSADRTFYAIEAATGALRWSYQTKAPLVAGSAVSEGLVFTGGGPHDGRILAFDPASGRLVWSLRTGFKIDSDPVAHKDRVYVTAGDGRVYALRVKKRGSHRPPGE